MKKNRMPKARMLRDVRKGREIRQRMKFSQTNIVRRSVVIATD